MKILCNQQMFEFLDTLPCMNYDYSTYKKIYSKKSLLKDY